MKQQYKIIRNPKDLSDEQIDRHKDFQKLLGNYEKVHKHGTLTKPFFRNFGIFTIVMVAGVVVLMLLLDKDEETNPDAQTTSSVVTDKKTKPSSATDDTITNTNVAKTPETTADKSGKVTVVASNEVQWKYIIGFDASKDLVHQLDNGLRILIDANTLLDKAGNPAKGKMELLYRDASDFSDKISVKKNSVEFEIQVREKATKAPVDLSLPACIEVPLKLSGNARVYHWSAPKERWQPLASELKFRFEIHSDQNLYKILENHVWEMSYDNYTTYSAYNYVFGKDWRQFEWNKSSGLKLKGSQNATTFNAIPARLFASPERQKQFEETVFQCYIKKSSDTCSGKTRTYWKANNIMLRTDISTVSINSQRTGLFLIEYETAGSNANKYRTLNLIAYPADTRGNAPDNYNP